MKIFFLSIVISLIGAGITQAQSLDKAQKKMDKYDYAKAIEILKKAADDTKSHNSAIKMLAECYRMQQDLENTKATYAQVVNFPDAKPISFFYYAQALQTSGDYTRAREMFIKYAEKDPTDTRGARYVAHCDSVLGPWKGIKRDYEIKLANNINTDQSDFGPAFCDGELVFASDFNDTPGEGKKYGWTGRGYLNIKKARPLSGGDFWGSMGAAQDFDSKFNTAYHDGPAAFSTDGNTIYFTRSYIGKAKREGIYKTNLLKIYFADKIEGNWSEVKPFFLNSVDYSVGHPTLSPDGLTLYFVSDMPGGLGGTDIWMCNREGDKWSNPINLGPVVNTEENEMFPSMPVDDVLYFASAGHAGYGALDIFESHTGNGDWSAPQNLHPPINSSYDDFAIAFVPGTDNGFFSTNRPGGKGSDDIYAFREKIEPELPSYISGFVKDKTTMKPLAGASVFVYNTSSGSVKIVKTDADGMYKTLVDNPADYSIKAMMPNFIADCSPLSVKTINPGSTIDAPRDLLLDKLVIAKTFKVDNIYYNFDKYAIRDDAKPELDKLVTIMKENRINVELGSHTDSRGSGTYNDKLSQKRAESAVEYIISAGIDASRISAKGYGERELTNHCSDGVKCTPAEHQANRRTEFKVTGFTAPVQDTDVFDHAKFNDGDEMEFHLLPAGFFMQCK